MCIRDRSITAAGKEACFILPVIFRERTRQRYERLYDTVFTIPFDGIIVKNYEEIGFLQRHAYTGTVSYTHLTKSLLGRCYLPDPRSWLFYRWRAHRTWSRILWPIFWKTYQITKSWNCIWISDCRSYSNRSYWYSCLLYTSRCV